MDKPSLACLIWQVALNVKSMHTGFIIHSCSVLILDSRLNVRFHKSATSDERDERLGSIEQSLSNRLPNK